MDDLAAWLTQIWDERAKAAQVALGHECDDDGPFLRHAADYLGWELADHIAANDPASVLARIAADRQILALHKHTADPVGWIDCGTCGEAGHEADKVKWCQHVRLLASPYADRPGYQEDWRP